MGMGLAVGAAQAAKIPMKEMNMKSLGYINDLMSLRARRAQQSPVKSEIAARRSQ